MAVYNFSGSNPWPEKWLEACEKELEDYGEGSGDRLMETEWMRFLMWDVAMQTGEFCAQLKEALAVCDEETACGLYPHADIGFAHAAGDRERKGLRLP